MTKWIHRKLNILLLGSLLTYIASPAQEKAGETLLLLQDLVNVVSETPDSLEMQCMAVPEILNEIVCDYFAEAVIDDEVAAEVLEYVMEVYRGDDYLPGLQRPVEGRLTSLYGYRPKFHRFHRGIDVALKTGDPVKCALPGVVVKTGYEKGGYGRYVVVEHSGGLETLYGHLSCSLVAPGQKLMAGDHVGLGGFSGNATGPHLHFETRYRGVAVDPLSLFNNSFLRE